MERRVARSAKAWQAIAAGMGVAIAGHAKLNEGGHTNHTAKPQPQSPSTDLRCSGMTPLKAMRLSNLSSGGV